VSVTDKKTNFYYQAFGLTIKSDFELFQLYPAAGTKSVDLVIEKGQVAKEGGHANPQAKDTERLFQISIGGVARFLILDGSKVIVDVDENADLQTVKLYLLGSCMGAILQQRGDLVLHGNAVRFADKVVIAVAQSGVGKSTLAGEFLRRGHELLADDVCAIDQKGYVQPSYPYLKLWQAALDKLEFHQHELTRIRLQKEKFYYPLKDNFCKVSLPVAAIYVLNKSSELDDLELTRLKGLEKIQALRNNIYRPSYARRMQLIHTHMQRFSEMLQTVELTRIVRPEHGFKLEELARLIMDDYENNIVAE